MVAGGGEDELPGADQSVDAGSVTCMGQCVGHRSGQTVALSEAHKAFGWQRGIDYRDPMLANETTGLCNIIMLV